MKKKQINLIHETIIVQNVEKRNIELTCYINEPENLSVSKIYLIEAFKILLFSSKL